MEKATIKMSVIANATLKFLISLPITKPITIARTKKIWLLVGLNMKGECDNLIIRQCDNEYKCDMTMRECDDE